ncbi:MAG TPA: PA14 domain-containing protein [Myxococcaceae bacterium]|jgi:hypothetical protein
MATALVIGGCLAEDQGYLGEEEPEELGQVASALTAQELDAYAQRGMDFVVQDTVTWVQNPANNCGACHRVGAPLYGASQAAYTGYTVNTTTANGTGYLANFLANEQYAAGYWTHGAGSHTFIKSAYNAFGLAGYTQFDNDVHLPKLQKAVEWAIGATVPHKFTNPLDGKALQGVTSVYVPQDHGSNPVTLGWQMPTAYFAVATRSLLDVGAGIPPLQRDNYKVFLRNMADSLEGQYARSNGAWLPQDVAFAAIGTIQDVVDRSPAVNTTVAAMRSELLNRYNPAGGWGDASIGTPNVYTTGAVLYALCLLDVRQDQNPTVASALNWLASQQCVAGNNYCGTGLPANNGSWVLSGHAGDVPTTFATLAMGCYGSLNVRVTLTPPSVQLAAGLGGPQTTQFTVKVKNTGYVRNTYNLVPSGNWPNMTISHNNPSMTLDPGVEANDVVTVTLPANMPESVIIPVSVKVSYLTKSGMVEKVVTFNVFIPPQPTAAGLDTITTILSPSNNAVIAPGTSVNLAASVKLAASGNPVSIGTLTFYSGSAVIATVQAVNGVFSYSWPVPASAPLGPQTFTATYNGFANANFSINYKGSSANGVFTIGYPNGSVCSSSAECQSGFCVDGVCCNSACGGGASGDCQACSRFAGALTDGTCGTVQAGFICRPSRGFCDVAEVCDGANQACPSTDVVQANGTSCGLNSSACSNGDCKTIPKGLNGRYFNNTTLANPFALNRVDTTVNFAWGTGSPAASVNADNFSTRWTGDVITPAGANMTGRYWFYTQSDQGVRLWVNGKLIIDNWTSHTTTVDSGSIYLEAGKRYGVMLEYFEGTGDANITLQWNPPNSLSSVIPSANLTPALNSPVTVRIRSPLDRTAYRAPASVNVDVDAVGLFATINSVELFMNGNSLGPKNAPPFQWPVTLSAQGVYVFTAKATGTATNSQGQPVQLVQFSRSAAVSATQAPSPNGTGAGLTADYFNGTNFNKFEFTRSENTVVLDGNVNSPLPEDILNPNGFSVRWTGSMVPAYSQAYTFSVNANHPARVWVNNVKIIDTQANPGVTVSAPVGLSAGQTVPVQVEYLKNSSTDTLMKLFWESQSEPKSLIPGTRLYPATASSF